MIVGEVFELLPYLTLLFERSKASQNLQHIMSQYAAGLEVSCG